VCSRDVEIYLSAVFFCLAAALPHHNTLKLNAPKSDEIAIYIDDMEKLAKKKKKTAQTNRQGTPGTLKKNQNFVTFY